MEPVVVAGIWISVALALPYLGLLLWRRLTAYSRAHEKFARLYFPEGVPTILGGVAAAPDAVVAPSTTNPPRHLRTPPWPSPTPVHHEPSPTSRGRHATTATPTGRSPAPAAGGVATMATATRPARGDDATAAEVTDVIGAISYHHPAA